MRSSFTLIALILTFLFTVNTSSVKAQDTQPVVKGQVTDVDGKPLEGVTINIKGQALSTVTNASGNYSLRIPDKRAVLVFTYVGLETQEVRVRNESTIDVRLLVSSQSMAGVVVTALNIKRNAKSLGYSISTIDGSKVNTVQTPSLVNALSGKVCRC